ncbi:hypothetical protein GOBAR_AA16010 [Gossypium barbadense]|uniref:Uncharacterized protein n=1 Tax=Gossypium barbadense TaxID=3634 RepID=A0A2P5XMU4_GOSBA|nr:hypothetical protein GOBAR_AA16010 [Gossypium barbadense]
MECVLPMYGEAGGGSEEIEGGLIGVVLVGKESESSGEGTEIDEVEDGPKVGGEAKSGRRGEDLVRLLARIGT